MSKLKSEMTLQELEAYRAKKRAYYHEHIKPTKTPVVRTTIKQQAIEQGVSVKTLYQRRWKENNPNSYYESRRKENYKRERGERIYSVLTKSDVELIRAMV